ncbi:hypothetical protein BH23ACT9_BH23ACT9_23000 [soil metagenome]
MEVGDSSEGVLQVVAASSVVTEYLPVLESGDAMLSACPPFAVPQPDGIANNPAASERRVVEFGDAAVAAVGVHPAVGDTVLLHV